MVAPVNGTKTPPVIEALNLVVLYGERQALSSLSLDVPARSMFGLLGPNGSGKSTFITLLAAMEPTPSGAYRVFGQEPSRDLLRRIGVVFQENTLDPVATAYETLEFAAHLQGINRDRDRLIRRRLADVNLAERANDAVLSLSGGMRRRLEIARALLHEPELLLFDEPTTGIDPGERQAIWDLIHNEQQGGRTVLVATNDLHEADGICDQVAFIRDGRVVAQGSPDELKKGLRAESIRLHWPDGASYIPELKSWEGIGSVVVDGDSIYLNVAEAAPVIARLFRMYPGSIDSVSIVRSSLQDAYFYHVGARATLPTQEADS